MDDCHKNVRSCVTIDVHPTCSDTTLIHLYLPTSPARLELLANKSVGDRLTVTGSFVEKNGGAMSADAPVMPTSWDDLEGSFTESGAMKEPEYSADISALE
jgi:hypothetical protein